MNDDYMYTVNPHWISSISYDFKPGNIYWNQFCHRLIDINKQELRSYGISTLYQKDSEQNIIRGPAVYVSL